EYPAVIGAQWVAFPGYFASVATGVNELISYLNQRVRSCPDEMTVLGGYSQGADVITSALARTGGGSFSDQAKAHMKYVALYGDPAYNNGGLAYCAYPQYTPPVPWQRGSARCNILNLPLAQRDPYVPT